jgi:hypothetical protein
MRAVQNQKRCRFPDNDRRGRYPVVSFLDGAGRMRRSCTPRMRMYSPREGRTDTGFIAKPSGSLHWIATLFLRFLFRFTGASNGFDEGIQHTSGFSQK